MNDTTDTQEMPLYDLCIQAVHKAGLIRESLDVDHAKEQAHHLHDGDIRISGLDLRGFANLILGARIEDCIKDQLFWLTVIDKFMTRQLKEWMPTVHGW